MKPVKVLAIRHIRRENAGTLETFLKKRRVELDYWNIAESKPLKEPSLNEYAALVILGGPMGVYEDSKYPFLRREQSFIEKALKSRIPTLGICLGAQLLAKVLGAPVRQGPWKEIGWYGLTLTEEGKRDPVLHTLPQIYREALSLRPSETGWNDLIVFQWHGDTFELPKRAVPLASSAAYKYQAFRWKDFCYAIQFHVEMTEPMIRKWIKEAREELSGVSSYIDPEAVLGESRIYCKTLRKTAEAFYDNLFMKRWGLSSEKVPDVLCKRRRQSGTMGYNQTAHVAKNQENIDWAS